MSTFFRSAAMTLLSRTLQALLYKYLSDVDVEGVALPSLLNSTDGHSGWGVRLSNVQLRQGAKLMDLPGKKPSRKKARQQKKPRQREKTKQQSKRERDSAITMNDESDHHRTPVDTASLQESEKSTRSSAEPIRDGMSSKNNGVQRQQQLDTEEGANIAASAAISSGSTCQSDGTYSLDTPTPATIYNEENAETATTTTTTNASPPTSSSSWFFWYPRSKSIQPNIPDMVIEEQHVDTKDNATAWQDDISASQEKPHNVPPPSSHNFQEDEIKTEQRKNDYDEEDDDEEDDDDDEEDEVEEPPLILRLGKHGRIGILDVRLVGKNIQVLVEDANLTIEVIRQPPVSTAADKDGNPSNSSNSANSSTHSNTARDNKQQKPKPDPKTTGDRVLAENAIARALSALPNLFLRDIKIRVIIRDDFVHSECPEDEGGGEERDDDAIIELGIDFLSVTDGEDFLANFRDSPPDDYSSSEDEDDEDDDDDESQTEINERPQKFKDGRSGGGDNSNEYLVKRIRTGRGPSGGISLRIIPQHEYLPDYSALRFGPLWARDQWRKDTELFVLRCSGLDVYARVFLGSKKELGKADTSWSIEDFDDFGVDSMLFGGVDYIAPGPQPPLPPMSSSETGPREAEDQPWKIPGATEFHTDENGIQSSGIRSNFHRVARGLKPSMCKKDHLPCEYCSFCWKAKYRADLHHPLDAAAPMGGLVLSITVRDPLDINLDRKSLETIGLVLSVFKKPINSASNEDQNKMPTPDFEGDELDVSETTSRSFLSKSNRSVDGSRSFLTRSNSNIRDGQGLDESRNGGDRRVLKRSGSHVRDGGNTSRQEMDFSRHEPLDISESALYLEEDLSNAFPSTMQPEKIQYLGVHITEMKFRVHLMTDSVELSDKAFSYFDIHAHCVTLDQQKLNHEELPFQDLRLDIGRLLMKEVKGVESHQLLSLGLRQRVVDFDEVTVETLLSLDEDKNRPPWPSTAAALLDIPPPLDTLVYESRERHAVQMRYIATRDSELNEARTHLNVKLGPAVVDAPFSIKEDVYSILRESRSSVFGPPLPTNGVDEASAGNNPTSLMNYKIQVSGGRIKLKPSIDVRLPQTSVAGVRSSQSGLFFETLLDHVTFAYGRNAVVSMKSDNYVSLQQLAQLPDNVRLRILLLLDDLRPLESALGLKPETNSFLRCRTVNKGILKAAQKHAHRYASISEDHQTRLENRRQELLTEFMKLDDDELEDLWALYQRNLRKNPVSRR